MPGLTILSEAELEAEEREQARQAAELRQTSQVVLSLASYVRRCWEAAKTAKQPIEKKGIDALRRRNGVYDPGKLSAIRLHGGSEIFMMMTDEKCAAFEAWIEDTILQAGVEPWGVEATPVPDLSPDQIRMIEDAVINQARMDLQMSGIIPTVEAMMQMAQQVASEVQARMIEVGKDIAQKVELRIQDVVTEGGMRKAIKEFVADLSTFPYAVFKGPEIQMEREQIWGEDRKPVVKSVPKVKYGCTSFFDYFPSPTSRFPGDGYTIERYRLTRAALQKLKNVEGYDTEAIDLVLKDYGSGSDWMSSHYDQERRDLERREQGEELDPEGKIDALRFWGNVQGLSLLEFGMEPSEISEPFDEYAVELWMVDHVVFKCVLNPDPLGRPPHYVTSFRKRNGTLTGDSLADVIKDSQDACNAAARNLINNMGIASGPQVGVDVSKLPAGATVSELFPWKIHQFDMAKDMGGSRPPIWFFQPQSLIQELMAVYEFFSKEADNKSGVPRYTYGGDMKGTAQGLSTATGMAMMMGNASKGIKKVINNIDIDVIEPCIVRTHQWLMLYDGDPILFMGDVKIVAKGSSSLIAKEQQQVRRNEILNIVLGSQIAAAILGPARIANLLRKVVQGADIDADDVVPTEEEMKRAERMQQMMMAGGMVNAGGGGPGGPGGPGQGMLPGGGGGRPGLPGPQPAEVNGAGDRVSGQDVRTF